MFCPAAMSCVGWHRSRLIRQPRGNKSYDPNRDRKLLLKAQEISYLIGKLKEKGLTVVPISIYTAHRLVKVELGVAKAKRRMINGKLLNSGNWIEK